MPFVKSSGFTKQAALAMCEGCRLSYRTDNDYVSEVLLSQGASNIQFLQSEEDSGMDVQALYFETTNNQWLFIRGTEGFKSPSSVWGAMVDWFQNFKASRIKWNEVDRYLVHKGFMQEFASISDSFYKATRNNAKPLRIGGHSKGGLLATLAAYDLRSVARVIDEVFTFGSCRGFGYSFSRKYNRLLGKRTYRAFHSNDIVPRMPFALRFKHVGVPVYLHESAGFEINPDPFRVLGYQISSYRGDFAEDHGLEGYHGVLLES